MVGEALFDVLCLTNVIVVCCFAQEDIDVERHAVRVGGADGIRTHDLLDAIEARSQLRHGPTDCLSRPSRFHRDALTKRSIMARSFHDLISRSRRMA